MDEPQSISTTTRPVLMEVDKDYYIQFMSDYNGPMRSEKIQKNWKFETVFESNPFGYACGVCDRLWFRNDLKQVKERHLDILRVEFSDEDVSEFQLCSNCRRSLDNTKEALQWLQNSTSNAGDQFQQFLKKHGHRCLKEFDVYSKTWERDPLHLVQILQKIAIADVKKISKEDAESFESILSHLQVELDFGSRLLLRFILPNCRRAVRDREFAKSLLIKSMHKIRRQPFHRLAEIMVEEGRLPNKEMMFFLCVEEINQLIKTRSPRMVMRAFKRWKCHGELDKLIFPEITCGIPEPLNVTEEIAISTGEELVMTGVPVSQGIVKATARVVLKLEQASAIQPGDVLITYSTDIGWSPYFPLLSGVVTELGGLISHGAVVAREYGLPCVVALHGATQLFKSGDLVVLDGNKGILRRVDNVQNFCND